MLGKIFGRNKKDDKKQDNGVVEDVASEAVKAEPTKKKKGFIGGLKDAAAKKMLEKQLKGMPQNQRDMIMRAMENHPEFFEKIAKETEALIKSKGMNQMAASMKVMRKYQSEMQKIMMEAQ